MWKKSKLCRRKKIIKTTKMRKLLNPKVGSLGKKKSIKLAGFQVDYSRVKERKNKLPMLGEKEWPSLQILLVLNSKQDDIKSNFTSINSTAKTKWTNFFKDTNYQN